MSADEQATLPYASQASDEWGTPPDFVRPIAEAIGGFGLDPCSGAERSPIAENPT